MLADATEELNEFKKKHEEAMKDLDAYTDAAKTHKELKTQVEKLEDAYKEAEQKLKHTALLAAVVMPKENKVEKQRIEEQY